jgi:hypothetical protein
MLGGVILLVSRNRSPEFLHNVTAAKPRKVVAPSDKALRGKKPGIDDASPAAVPRGTAGCQ